ncbi:MAG TPA: hypothetical protein VEQ85_08370, partial [Lacipirellulaceae bacterium]|nr:hypothetical protein [Lacipirellulaceae bacterium]
RRGVLLLVVLSLLVLFLMVGTAFIVVAKQSEKAAKIATKSSLQDANAAARGNILDEVILQIVRDTDNPNSALRSHSLLADLYGNDGFSATAASVAWAGTAIGTPTATSGQMLEIKLDATTLRDAFGEQTILLDAAGTPLDPLHFLSPLDDAYAGLVLTFTSGPARGQSTRIVAYRRELTGLPNAGPLFTIMNVPAADGSLIADPTVLATSRFVVNGRPYNGTGVGYNVAPAGLNERLALLEQLQLPSGTLNAPLALLPGTVYTDATKLTNSGVTLAPQWLLHAQHQSSTARFLEIADKIGVGGRGGSDEPYDAPDFQNMLLAAIQDEPEDSTDPTRASLEDMILPSLHRPELINYWAAQLATADPANSLVRTGNGVLLRKVMLRPNHLDHPNFNGSNPELTAALLAYKNATPDADAANRALLQRYVYGPWDVDNDNDGARDSVWVDVGAPVILGPNGKLVKPLVAILCTDLDGRININTAGTLDLVGEVPEPDEVPLADGQESDDTPRGSGWGPAEISPRAALGPNSSRALVAGPPGGTSAARVL